MKLQVKKELKSGKFIISIRATDFTEEERTLFAKFGPPQIDIYSETALEQVSLLKESFIRFKNIDSPISRYIPLSMLNISFSFANEEDANNYKDKIIKDIKTAMENLRQKKDTFTSEEIIEI